MGTSRREQISALYHAALERPPAERSAFLNEACEGEPALQQDVESLLRYQSASAQFLEGPAANILVNGPRAPNVTTDMVGRQLGPYKVIALLGSGGMGEVYRARDTSLKRDVALKILPDSFSADPERLARFQREAEVLALLNHPNIAAIYGLLDDHGAKALLMELVEGEDLADRIARGPIPVDEALPIAKQIAEALEAAHEQGIIHRDLKPANIKLRPDGAVKVLDFGLAKAFAVAQDARADARAYIDPSNSPTITGPGGMTAAGVLLGTAAYMPPEQARGKPVDKRADIWAFGCVLFEMLTGTRCFDGQDTSLTLAEVIKSEPDWNALPPSTPPAVRSTLAQCLKKDPKQRIRDVGDVGLALDGGFASVPPTVHDRPAQTGGRWARAALLAAAGVAVGAIGTAAINRFRPIEVRPPAHVNRFTITLPAATTFADNTLFPFALTRDGRRLVLNAAGGATQRVFVRSMDQTDLLPVYGLEGVGSIFLSPDGEWLAFNDSKGSFKRMRLAGGQPTTISETGLIGPGFRGATWGTAGTLVFSTAAYRGLMEVPEAGGIPKPRTNPDESEDHMQPHFLPDGRSLLFVVRRPAPPHRIAFLPAGASEYVELLEGRDPRYASSGHILFTREAAVWAVGFDADAGRTYGDPAPVLEGASVGRSGVARMTVSADGTLAYAPGVADAPRTIVRVDRRGREETLPGLPPDTYETIKVSPDGTRLAFGGSRSRDVWTYDFSRGTATRVTTDAAEDRGPSWTPDGTRLLFTSTRGGPPHLYWQNADGTGAAERFLLEEPSGLPVRPNAWTNDGKTLLVTFGRFGNAEIGTVNVDGERRVTALIAMPSSIEAAAALSPDGRWIAYQSSLSGTLEVYVERFPELGDRQKISINGGTAAQWSADGRELFYLSPGGRVVAVPMSTGPKLVPGTPQTLFEGPFLPMGPRVRPFDVMPDGRFILIKEAAAVDPNAPGSIVVVQNWVEELKRLVPTR